MKWLPFKLAEQEKQAMKEVGKSPAFKFYQKEVIIYLILLVLAFVFLWKHQNILMLFVVPMAVIIGARYSQALKSSKATYSLGEKVEKEIKRQQEVTKKVALPVIFGMVGVFILFMAGLIVYVLYLKPIVFKLKAPSVELEEKTKIEVRKEQYPSVRELTKEVILNGEYDGSLVSPFEGDKGKLIKFTNGAYEVPAHLVKDLGGGDWYTGINIFPQAFGDLNNDGKEDAVVNFGGRSGGTGSWSCLRVVTVDTKGSPYIIPEAKICGSDREGFENVVVQKNGIIIVDMLVHGPNDALCCPSVKKAVKYRLSENELIEIIEDETANWKTYRNEEYRFEVKYPDGWTVNQEWWGSAVKSPVFDFKSPKGDREIYIQIETSMFEELWRGSYDIITEKELAIGGIIGSKIVGVFKPTNRQEIFALVKKGENLYHIHFPVFYQDEEFLEQILSTFRFLE